MTDSANAATGGAASPPDAITLPPTTPLTLWYDRPAQSAMNEALPIGNGRLGGVVFGGTVTERFAFNEDSLWTGDANPSGEYDTMGAYQAFGDVFIDLPDHNAATDYRRDLDLANALAHVAYRANGINYTREFFASHPAQVVAIRLTADKPGAYSGTVRLQDAHHALPQLVGEAALAIMGTLANGLRYEARFQIIADGGSISPLGNGLAFRGCNSLTILLAAATDYAMDHAHGYRTGAAPHERLVKPLQDASAQTYDALRADHLRDYRALFDRVTLDLGPSPADRRALPTDQRKRLAASGGDPELEATLFQYGRYLLIACSRPGSLPANLQGLWNDSNDPPWHSDYHTNINIQMNYWPAEATGLPDCHLPLFDLIASQLPAWRTATAVAPKEFATTSGTPIRGWAVRTSHNTTGGMGWNWDKTANAWYCQHFYEHWAFTGDRDFLKNVAYPVLRETCEFWQDHLKALPDGRLVVPNAWSPEHGPVEDGVSYSQEIVWDLFTNYLDAADALQIDPDYRAQIAALRDRLVVPAIGRWGQLQEWMTDRDDPNDHHRHTSHLFAVYPGRQITVARTPALAAAAAKSLIARGDSGDVREWSFAWRTALYARLHDPERAHAQLLQFLADRNSCPNLFGLHPPMQIDGNFGITAALAETLLQSHEGEIHLLPALPAAWPTGRAHGLRARGGITIDMEWSAGKLTHATLHRTAGSGKVRLRSGDAVAEVSLKSGGTARLGEGLVKG